MVNRICVFLLLVIAFFAHPVVAQQSEAARKLFNETKARADKGDAQAQLAVGGFYDAGAGVSADPKKAVRYYRKAAEQGLAAAQFQLGMHSLNGDGLKEIDESEGVFWLNKAAEQGFLEAQIELARCLLTGKGGPPNGAEALRWFRKAAAQGSVASEYYIGKCYFEGTGVPKDIQEGFAWTRRAADAGYPPAQNALGTCFEQGRGVEKDYVQAYKWFALAAAQDDANALDIRVSLAKAEGYLTKEQVAEAQRQAREFKASQHGSNGASAEGQPGAASSGTVTVTAEDAQSEVYADGAFVGNTPAKLKLKEGPHIIEVKRSGFKDYRRELNVGAGSDLTLRAVLEK